MAAQPEDDVNVLFVEDDPSVAQMYKLKLELDGLAVLEALRADERTKQVPVVILSNYSERELVERGLRLGALEYLIKSQTTPAKLATGVESWLRG